ncbi:Purine nucleoside phosphorylase [Dimargaris xerosporica]|nr:Purine nucleoside phosphorylase [Dimargaris xerosporica]
MYDHQLESSDNAFETCKGIAEFLKKQLPPSLFPKVGIVCGSGLGALADNQGPDFVSIKYSEIPNFPRSTVAGHDGRLVFSTMGSKPTVFMVGRFHFYEGYKVQTTILPLRVMKLLGVKTLIVTNAAGSLNPNFKVGDVVMIKDHISIPNLAGLNPLRGGNLSEFGPRFPAVSEVYDFELRALLALTYHRNQDVQESGMRIHEGIYGFVPGPSYETPAEGRFLRSIGVDVVGMSTVPEIIAAAHCGFKVLCISLVTNLVITGTQPDALEEGRKRFLEGKSPIYRGPEGEDVKLGKATHAEVLAASTKRVKDIRKLINYFVKYS